MLIRKVDDETELHLLERKHAGELEALDPGDLTFSQGEWIGVKGRVDAWMSQALGDFAAGTRLEAGIFRNGLLIGIVSLQDIDRDGKSAGLNYALDGKWRGRGIMTRCCRALIAYAYEELDLNRIEIVADVGNIPSCRIPEKIGFAKESVMRACYRSADGFRDCARYSLLKSEWKGG